MVAGQDLNPRPSGYEPDELPDCSTPQQQGEEIIGTLNNWCKLVPIIVKGCSSQISCAVSYKVGAGKRDSDSRSILPPQGSVSTNFTASAFVASNVKFLRTQSISNSWDAFVATITQINFEPRSLCPLLHRSSVPLCILENGLASGSFFSLCIRLKRYGQKANGQVVRRVSTIAPPLPNVLDIRYKALHRTSAPLLYTFAKPISKEPAMTVRF